MTGELKRGVPGGLLDSEAEIRAVIPTLDPVAQTAAQGLASYLLENPRTAEQREDLYAALVGSVAFAMRQSDWSLDDGDRVADFFDAHGDEISRVALSIARQGAWQAGRWRWWRWPCRFDPGAFTADFFR